MKNIILLLILLFSFSVIKSQTCEEILQFVKSEGSGRTFYSFDSDAITKITFYEVSIDYETYYFAVVVFTSSFKEYIYQVAYNTKTKYGFEYLDSAGKAFWNCIHPYNKNLGCAPKFE